MNSTLPVQETTPVRQSTAQAETDIGRILLVDDQPNNLKVLTATLAPCGYKLLTALKGERAYEIAVESQPDLILLDINLPDITGFEVCRLLKDNPKTKHIPVIFLSALDDVQSKVEGFRAGGIDYVTKPFYKEEVIARIQTQLEIQMLRKRMRLRNRELREANANIQESIQYAKRIQDALMPETSILSHLAASMLIFRPKDIVSGDFLWCSTRDNLTFFGVADCTGHGVPGCFMTVLAMPALNNILDRDGTTNPAAILEELDIQVQRMLRSDNSSLHVHDGMDIVLCCLNRDTNVVTYASANRPVLLARGGQLEELGGDRRAIGGRRLTDAPFSSHEISVSPGDRIFLYTDGITDQFGGDSLRKFSPRRLREVLTESLALSMPELNKNLEDTLNDYMGDQPQTDDILLLGVEF